MTQEHQPIVEHNLLDSTAGKAFAGAVIVAEVSPLNEVIRGALTVGAGVISRDPILAGAVFGVSTAVIEGGAALVTAEALDTTYGKNLISKVNGKLRAVGVNENAKTGVATDFGVSMLGGSAVSMLVKHAQDPERTRTENRAYGLKMTAAVSVVSGGLGYAAAEGIANPGVETIGAAAIALGGIGIFMGWAKRKVSK